MDRQDLLFAPITPSQATHFACEARFVADYGTSVIKLLSPEPGEKILDVGCGDGTLSRLVQAGGAEVVGIDIDAAMVEASRQNGIDARLMDGRALAFQCTFDAAFSNAALHFMRPVPLVIESVARALKPGGRFAAELGSHGNIAAITTGLVAVLDRRGIDGGAHIPWDFLTAEEFCDSLETAGFLIDAVHTFHRPTPMPSGAKAWIEKLGRWFLDALPPEQRDEACEEAARLMSHTMKTARGHWTADYHHLRFKARLATK
ncbi:methyltransferase domain-containing protein [Xanthobacter sp. KR7-65]|uniref:class I SAM-dependent methyltransferase n=1 Tax=Xanthobacter sp. KR7-65 TaxID=3156612 RepID=UPI0032B39E88